MEEIPVQPQPITEPQPVKKPFFSKTIAAVFIIIVILILLPAGAYLFLNSNKQVACTTEAKICPDGSSVGRTGPKCEFTACPKTKPTPTPNPTADWKTYVSKEFSYSIKYPSVFEADDQHNGNNNTIIEKIINQPSGPSNNFISISVIPQGFQSSGGDIYNYSTDETNALLGMKVGETKEIDSLTHQNFTRINDAKIGDINSQAYLNTKVWEFTAETKEYRYYLNHGDFLYEIVGYVNGSTNEDNIPEQLFQQILSTFKFTQ